MFALSDSDALYLSANTEQVGLIMTTCYSVTTKTSN